MQNKATSTMDRIKNVFDIVVMSSVVEEMFSNASMKPVLRALKNPF